MGQRKVINAIVGNDFNRNYVINGDFRVDQRSLLFVKSTGLSISNLNVIQAHQAGVNTTQYITDRWKSHAGIGGSFRIITNNAPVDGQNAAGIVWQQTVGSSSNPVLEQFIWGDVLPEQEFSSSASAVLSFYAGILAGSGNLIAEVRNQFGTLLATRTIALTATTQKYELGFLFSRYQGATVRFLLPIGSTYSIRLTRVQVELGNKSTSFKDRALTEEVALCRRFFQTYGTESNTDTSQIAFQMNFMATAIGQYRAQTSLFSPPMRFAPLLTSYNASSVGCTVMTRRQRESFQITLTSTAIGDVSLSQDFTLLADY